MDLEINEYLGTKALGFSGRMDGFGTLKLLAESQLLMSPPNDVRSIIFMGIRVPECL